MLKKKESACYAGDLSSLPGLGGSPEEGKSCLLQYAGLENAMDCIVHGVTELDTTERLSRTSQHLATRCHHSSSFKNIYIYHI